MMFAVAIAALVLSAGLAYMVFYEDKSPTVTLSSGGQSIESVRVTEGGFVDVNWLEYTQCLLVAPEPGLNFAGWYTDPSCQDVFFRYTPIKGDTTIYAGWNDLSFTVTQSEPVPSEPNKLTCIFTNTTNSSGSMNTTWVISDSFKTSGTIPGTASGLGIAHTATLNMGMYDITMTVYTNGEMKRMVRNVVVGEDVGTKIEKTVNWAFEGSPYTLTYSMHVSEYIEFAKMNRDREFKIPQIANHVVWDIPVIGRIVNELKDIMPGGLSEQQQMNFIMLFLNGDRSNGYWESDSTYYRIPSIHPPAAESVEYYKYPAEALYDWAVYGNQGDCDCMAILTAAVARAYGFEDVAIIVLTNPNESEGHAVAGIKNGSFAPIARPDLTSITFFFQLDGYYASDTVRFQKVGELGSKYESSNWIKSVFRVTA